MQNVFSIALTLFLVIDALGIIPIYLSLVKKVDKKKGKLIIVREMGFALIIMIFFNYIGEFFFPLLGVTNETVQVSGGIIIFLIALRLIFSIDEDKKESWEQPKEPFIVPIATPLFAGPSVLSVIMIYAKNDPSQKEVLLAIFLAWLVSAIILFFASTLYRLIGEKGLLACQRLMGLIVSLVAVQMFLQGIQGFFSKS